MHFGRGAGVSLCQEPPTTNSAILGHEVDFPLVRPGCKRLSIADYPNRRFKSSLEASEWVFACNKQKRSREKSRRGSYDAESTERSRQT